MVLTVGKQFLARAIGIQKLGVTMHFSEILKKKKKGSNKTILLCILKLFIIFFSPKNTRLPPFSFWIIISNSRCKDLFCCIAINSAKIHRKIITHG